MQFEGKKNCKSYETNPINPAFQVLHTPCQNARPSLRKRWLSAGAYFQAVALAGHIVQRYSTLSQYIVRMQVFTAKLCDLAL
jgi:hypothetical protein